jgi:hypothetical protein
LLQWNDPKHTQNHRIRPVENQDSSILFNVLQVHGRTLAKLDFHRSSTRRADRLKTRKAGDSTISIERPANCPSMRVRRLRPVPVMVRGHQRPSLQRQPGHRKGRWSCCGYGQGERTHRRASHRSWRGRSVATEHWTVRAFLDWQCGCATKLSTQRGRNIRAVARPQFKALWRGRRKRA